MALLRRPNTLTTLKTYAQVRGFLCHNDPNEAMGALMTKTEPEFEIVVRSPSRRYSLLLVAVALIAGLILRLGILGIAAFFGQRQAAASSGSWAGLGTILLGAALGLLVGYVLAIVTVGVGMRRRSGGRRFTVVFAVILAAVQAVPFAVSGVGGLALPSAFYGVPLGFVPWVGVPMLWALPAATIGLLRWRWLAVIGAVGVIVVLVISGSQKLQADHEQSSRNSSYRGPSFAPSTSPGSPLPGYRLRSVKLPGPYERYRGATQISLSYFRPAADVYDQRYYSIDFSLGQDALYCGGEFGTCPTVGTALGHPILRIASSGSYGISLERGVIMLEGSLTPDEAVSIFGDLKAATVDEIAALRVDPRFAIDG